MATKTITLELDAYEKLKRAKRGPRESFSSVVRRARWDESPAAGHLLGALREVHRLHPESFLDDAALDRIEERASTRERRLRVEADRRVILDTTVLVDFQRELRRSKTGAATALLERFADEQVSIAFVTWMELAEAFEDPRREDCERFLSPFPVLWPDIEVSWEASRIARRLAADGRSIGDHDAWIAAFGLRHCRPVVTRNNRHFSRVPGLEVRSY